MDAQNFGMRNLLRLAVAVKLLELSYLSFLCDEEACGKLLNGVLFASLILQISLSDCNFIMNCWILSFWPPEADVVH